MNTEDSEFNRIEMEAKVRMMAVQYAVEKQQKVPAPIVTPDELEALIGKPDA